MRWSSTNTVTLAITELASDPEHVAGTVTSKAATPAGLTAKSVTGIAGNEFVDVDPDNPRLPAEVIEASSKVVLHDSYAGKGTAALTTADTGQSWTTAGAINMSIIADVMGSDATGGAGYVDTDLGARVHRVGARWLWLSAGSTDGTLAMLAWATSVATAPFPPDSPCHLTIEPDQVGFGVWDTQVFSPLLTYNFPQPLETDGATVYEAEIILEGDTATIRMPDGSIHTVTDSRIATLGADFAGFEVVQDATDHFPRFLDVWAETVDDTPFSSSPIGSIYRALAPSSKHVMTTGPINTAVGYGSQNPNGSGAQNTAVGAAAQQALTTAATATAVGYGAQQDLTTGNSNTAVGALSQTNLSTGATNTGVGNNVQRDLSTGGNNTAVGGSAQWAPAGVTANATTTASFQTCVGSLTGQGSSAASDYITCLGYSATGIGTGALALGAFAAAGFTQSVALGYNVQTTAVSQVCIENRHIEFNELAADPAAGAANSGRLYVKDDGAGKTQLCVRFATGVVQVIASEP